MRNARHLTQDRGPGRRSALDLDRTLDRTQGARMAAAGFFDDLAPEGDRPLGMGLAGVALLAGIVGLSSGWFGAPPPGPEAPRPRPQVDAMVAEAPAAGPTRLIRLGPQP